MNKKFSTLLAAVALVGSMSANAQELTAVEQGDAISLQKGSVLAGLTKDTKNGLYQLKTTDGKFLVMEETAEGSGDYKLFAKSTDFDLENSLWCVTSAPYSQGQAVKFDFMNKGTGMMLDLAMTGAAGLKEGETWEPLMGGEISGWAFSKTVETLEPRMPLYSGFTTDSVVGLQVNDKGAVVAAKYLRSKVKVDNTEGADADANTFTSFTLYYADEVALSETQLNTLFTVQSDAKAGVTLKFSPDIKGTSLKNPFNAQKFIAKDSEDNLTSIGNWLYVGQKDKDAYLKVDTAYTNTTGVKFLAYGWTEAKDDAKAIDRVVASDIKDQHKFMFVYSPSKDDLRIYVKQITWKADSENKKYWKDVVKDAAIDADGGHKRGNWRVSLQDLIKDETRILTVDAKKQNTTISLGYGGCDPVEQTKTTLADGVYYIMNSAGKYLASPIYRNGEIEWTTVNADEQNVAHMPAYQWVILKKNQNDKTNTSAVELINREYPNTGNAANYTLNLNKKEGGNYYYVTVEVSAAGDTKKANASILKTDSLSFDLVPEASVTDSLLGYKNLTNGELLVNKYTFNYWHPYAADRYIAQSSKDSTLTVNAGMAAFKLDTADRSKANYAVEMFGYTVSKDVQARIKGLKQLYRTAYNVTLDGKSLAINKEAKFNATKAAYTKTDGNTAVSPFFFKENNQITETGKCYYAILSTTKNDENYYSISENNKAGVSDYDGAATLKAQFLNETRTSAFAIEPDNTPLYRRFDSAELEGNEGDKADTLRFIEKYRKEYLQVENNKNFMNGDIDFLGIYTPEKTEDGLSFIVDTAWVNRGAGNIKPQYLISIDRNDFEGTPGVPCTYTHNHFDNEGNKVEADKCSHATPAIPGFERGKYLINFHDFAIKHDKANTSDAKKDAAYMWKKYDRAGFVEAVRVADTLFILRDEFKNLKNEEITIEALNKAEEAALAAAKKAGVNKDNFVSYKYVLSGDNHKYVTWSMRFVDRNAAANKVEADRSFLFESMKADALDIAPTQAAWLKMQNGCLVLSADDSKFNEQATGGDDALIFNVEQGDDIATDNETIDTVEGISITTDNGTVTIQGAAGKSVVISNILGKVVAETILSSDNATISVPAGIVAVAVDGEEAVKVVVK